MRVRRNHPVRAASQADLQPTAAVFNQPILGMPLSRPRKGPGAIVRIAEASAHRAFARGARSTYLTGGPTELPRREASANSRGKTSNSAEITARDVVNWRS
jgi:hypothetical protein